jgi:hypothetical protein
MSMHPFFTRDRNGALTILGELQRRAWWAGFLRGMSAGFVLGGFVIWWLLL